MSIWGIPCMIIKKISFIRRFYSHLNSDYMLNGEIGLTINPRLNSNNLPNFHR